MKKSSSLIICLMFAFVLTMFSGCKKEKKITITEYIGTVVEGSTMEPLPNVIVSVTNGSRVLVSDVTDSNGAFSFEVNFEKVTENDSLLIDGGSELPYQKKFELKGMGKEQYDYRTIILYYKVEEVVKTFQYNGTTYYVHPEIGTMDWQSALYYCDNLSYAGYSDWFLPDKDELNAMYLCREIIGGFATTGYGSGVEVRYWSSTPSSTSTTSAWYQNFMSGRPFEGYMGENLRIRPIRKD